LSKHKSIEFNQGHVSDLEYQGLFQIFKNTIFLYQPSTFSYCSSGRVCDAVVSKNNIFVPKETALEDFTLVHGNCHSFDFEDSSSLAKILMGDFKVSERTQAPSLNVENAISSLITMINKAVPVKAGKISDLVFWPTAFIGWIISSIGYYLAAAVFKIRN
jgi:hypothetical protein